jgi:hypothetical protein
MKPGWALRAIYSFVKKSQILLPYSRTEYPFVHTATKAPEYAPMRKPIIANKGPMRNPYHANSEPMPSSHPKVGPKITMKRKLDRNPTAEPNRAPMTAKQMILIFIMLEPSAVPLVAAWQPYF